MRSPEVQEHPWVPLPQENALVWEPPIQHEPRSSGKTRKEEMMSENGDPSPMHASLGPNICITGLCAWLACTLTIYNSTSSSLPYLFYLGLMNSRHFVAHSNTWYVSGWMYEQVCQIIILSSFITSGSAAHHAGVPYFWPYLLFFSLLSIARSSHFYLTVFAPGSFSSQGPTAGPGWRTSTDQNLGWISTYTGTMVKIPKFFWAIF